MRESEGARLPPMARGLVVVALLLGALTAPQRADAQPAAPPELPNCNVTEFGMSAVNPQGS